MMLSLKCALIISIFCGIVFQNAAAHSTEGTSNIISEQSDFYSEKNSSISSNLSFSLNPKDSFLDNLIIENSTKFTKPGDFKLSEQKKKNKKSPEPSLKSFKKGESENNETFNDILSLLPFPLVPFLFPTKKAQERFDGSFESSETLPTGKGENEPKMNASLFDAKPFVFFKFAFNIRQIPSDNKTESKIIRLKKENKQKEDFRKKSQKNRKKRNAMSKREKMGYFDDFPLFPDSDADEFFPKTESFFPDLFQLHKPLRKLSRKKRGTKKRNISLVDVFNDAFTRIQKEFEESNPFLRFFPESDKTNLNDFFGGPIIPNHSEKKPKVNLRIQRNTKRFKENNYNNEFLRAHDSPVIIVDKVVKIGEFHVNDDDIMKDEDKRKKEGKPLKAEEILKDKSEATRLYDPQSFFDFLRLGPFQNNYSKEGSHNKVSRNSDKSFTRVQSKEIKILPQSDTSLVTVGNNATIELKNKNIKNENQNSNYTNPEINYAGNLLKVMESLKAKVEEEDAWKINATGSERILKKRGSSGQYNQNSKHPLYEDLEKNITKVLSQFLTMFKYLSDAKLESNENSSFDWTENETLEESSFIPKKRQKKNFEFLQDDIDFYEDDERQIADLYYLFLVITLPTLIGFALLLFLCFVSFQVKGALCTKLFKPRHVYVYEEALKFSEDEEVGPIKNIERNKQEPLKKEELKTPYDNKEIKMPYGKQEPPPTYNKPSEELKKTSETEKRSSKCHRKRTTNETHQPV